MILEKIVVEKSLTEVFGKVLWTSVVGKFWRRVLRRSVGRSGGKECLIEVLERSVVGGSVGEERSGEVL